MGGKHKQAKQTPSAVPGVEKIQLTKEAQLTHKTKWELFLEGYRSYFNAEFSWPAYIKECKLYYGEFNIHDFIRTYGPDCEADFKRFRRKILEQKGINRPVDERDAFVVDPSLLEMMVNGDNLRTRMLIRFLTPETRAEKRNMKRSWRSAKKMGYAKREWLKSYVGIAFRVGKPDPLDDKYTREEVFMLITDAKKRLDELRDKQKNPPASSPVPPTEPKHPLKQPSAFDQPLSAPRPKETPLVPDRHSQPEALGVLPVRPQTPYFEPIQPSQPAPRVERVVPPQPIDDQPFFMSSIPAAEPVKTYPPRQSGVIKPEPVVAPTPVVDQFSSDSLRAAPLTPNTDVDVLSTFRPSEKFGADNQIPAKVASPLTDLSPSALFSELEDDDLLFEPKPAANATVDALASNDDWEVKATAPKPLTPEAFLRDYQQQRVSVPKDVTTVQAQDLNEKPKTAAPAPKVQPANAMSAALRFEQHVDAQTRAVKHDNLMVTKELHRVSEITHAEQARYEQLRAKRKQLTAELAAATKAAQASMLTKQED